MPKKLLLYLDDSGTRNPNKSPAAISSTKTDSFSIGGILYLEEDKATIEHDVTKFKQEWKISSPLHSYRIRNHKSPFNFSENDRLLRKQFLEELERMLCNLPVWGIACVIDRQGYNRRYDQKYGQDKWSLCKTAFSIVVERAAKHALKQGRRLVVSIERSDIDTDKKIKTYFNSLKTIGMPFSVPNSQKYAPLSQALLNKTLYDLRFKTKESVSTQISDLYLWPIVQSAGQKPYRPYEALFKAGRLVECGLTAQEIGELGSKFSCFDQS